MLKILRLKFNNIETYFKNSIVELNKCKEPYYTNIVVRLFINKTVNIDIKAQKPCVLIQKYLKKDDSCTIQESSF